MPGTRTLPSFPPPIPRAWPPASLPVKCLDALAKYFPWRLGGSAYLARFNKTISPLKGRGRLRTANQVYKGVISIFRVRQHAMGATVKRALSVLRLRAYNATFLQFQRLHKPAMRLAAFEWKHPPSSSFTHDSIGLRLHCPTIQPPIEQLSGRNCAPCPI